MPSVLIAGLIVLSALFGLFGIWLLVGQRATGRDLIEARLRGVRQVKKYELGDALAESRQREQRKKERRREALRKQAFSDIPVLDHALRRATWAEKLNGMLLQAQIPISATNFAFLSAIMAALGVAVTVLWRKHFDPPLAVIFAAAMGSAPIIYVWLKVRRRLKIFGRQLPDALDLLSSSVRAGQSLNAAIQSVAEQMPDPVGDEFRILSDELTFGVPFETAMQHFMTRVNTPDVRFFASALLIQKETGGNLAEVLDGLQKTIRDRFRILGQVRTLTAQGKLSGLIVGTLPLVLCALIYFANPDYMVELFTTKTGHTLLIIGGVLELIGVFLIIKIVNIKV